MNGLAQASRIFFALIGTPLTAFGFIMLFRAFTGDDYQSWAELAGSLLLLPIGAVCMTTAFVAQLVVNSNESR